MRAARILETALYVRDVAQAIAFYRDVMGLEPVGKVSGRNAFFRCGEGILLLFKAEETLKAPAPGSLPVPPHGTSGPGHVCFAAERDEIDSWVGHLEKHGVAIESDFEWPNGARSIYFRDPFGNSLEIAEPKLWD
ncbi:glyoxalase/bleomycin resistance/extradiol dioxygenase family protein [Falsochrobactrum shanghaiense]|uniref:Glyoxalase/bleomycin resistance/extradiol dioxygenase family protein n=1 Tax=Falsochrobactrum shanghaiense TaxID=2201899 RepID=A0A316JFF8_9HYPH|nr:VOC family protein [Falsochrobactrum shanghaiense]PWL19315.1 glyoxalase/bleomycin resistance/extradiol dioxygenase family protein [Falsochrobactrum shanghaiense]